MTDSTIYKLSKILVIITANLAAVFLYSLLWKTSVFGFLGWLGFLTFAGNIKNVIGIIVLVLWTFIAFGIPLIAIIVSGVVAYKWIKESEEVKAFYRIVAVISAILIWVGWYFGLEKIIKIVGYGTSSSFQL